MLVFLLIFLSTVHETSCQCTDSPVWFVQLTDTHLSHLGNRDRADDLRWFIETRLAKIKPAFVIHSGDITHGVHKRGYSGQHIDEWKSYKSIWSAYQKLLPGSPWCDVRGNHDVFNVRDWNSSTNYYREFRAPSGSGDKRLNQVIIKSDHGCRHFVLTLLDTTLDPGIGRTLNFFGAIKEDDIGLLRTHVETAMKMSAFGAPLFIGHHPIAYVQMPPGKSLLKELSVGAFYLCGHLHTAYDMVPQMYYRHNDRLIELELGDWKDNRRYRIAVWDRKRFSFADFSARDDVVVVPVYPPRPGLSLPSELQSNETDISIRILVFSFTSPVREVVVLVDKNGPVNLVCHQPNESLPLWQAEWKDRSMFVNRKRQLEFAVTLSDGKTTVHKAPVCLGCFDTTYGIKASIALTFLDRRIIFFIYLVLVGIHALTLIVFHYCEYKPSGSLIGRSFCCRIRRTFLASMSAMCKTKFVFWTLLIDDIYAVSGPWLIGLLTENTFGASFVWGLAIQGSVLQADVQILSATFLLLLARYPMTLALASILQFRVDRQSFPLRYISIRFVIPNAVMLWTVCITFVELSNHWKPFRHAWLFSPMCAFNPWVSLALWGYAILAPPSKPGTSKQHAVEEPS